MEGEVNANGADSAAARGTTRKERFRQYFRAVSPTASSADGLRGGLVLPDLRRIISSRKTIASLFAEQHPLEHGIASLYLVAIARHAGGEA